MKQIIKSVTLFAMAGFLVAGALVVRAPQKALAFSSCPTDLLSALTPYNTNYNDSNSVNAGVKFDVHGAPYVTGVKFYKGVDNTGTHVAHLRVVGGTTDLASATFTSESSSGWQTVYFNDPVPVSPQGAGDYEVWVSMPNGHYAADGGGAGGDVRFDTAIGDTVSGAVYIPAGDSGLYEYTSDDTAEPTNEINVNYWVSPIVDDQVAPADVGGLAATDDQAGPLVHWTTAAGDNNEAYDLGYNTVRTDIIRTEGMNSVTVGSQYGSIPYWTGATGEQQDVTALPGKDYTYTVKVYDGCGNASTGATDSVSTASQSLSTVFDSATPAYNDTQTDPSMFGMHWQTDTAGEVWGARIYRAPGTLPTVASAGRFKAILWDNNGDQLASAWMPAGNAQTGWIDVRFDSPVAVDANHDYVISYYSPIGQESYTTNAFTSAVTNGNLTGRADTSGTPNGVYAQGSGVTHSTFPTNRAGSSTWYGVDVDFYIP
jgi:hypothetical protein